MQAAGNVIVHRPAYVLMYSWFTRADMVDDELRTIVNPPPPPPLGAALVQFVPSDVSTFPAVPGTAYVSVLYTIFVPSDTSIFLAVPELLGYVGVDQVGTALLPPDCIIWPVEPAAMLC